MAAVELENTAGLLQEVGQQVRQLSVPVPLALLRCTPSHRDFATRSSQRWPAAWPKTFARASQPLG